MVVEAAPASSFEMSEPDLLFELLIIALDTPTQFGEVHELAEGNVFRQGRKPIFGRLFLPFWPFDQQPLFGPEHDHEARVAEISALKEGPKQKPRAVGKGAFAARSGAASEHGPRCRGGGRNA